MSTRVVAALDQGTTSSRCLLFDRHGRVLGAAQQEHRQFTPGRGLVEHDPAEIRDRVFRTAARALKAAGLTGRNVAAVGITNQRETAVVWDPDTGEPLAPAIVWQDTRTRTLADRFGERVGVDRLREITGLPPATYFSGPKLQWFLDNTPGLRERARAGKALFGTVDSWILWHLTGDRRHCTDATNASRTQLMDLESCDWCPELLEALDVPGRMLPEIVPSSDAEAFGHTRSDGPFGAAVPIAGTIGDQQAALLGQQCRRPGEAKCTYGTGAFLLLHTGKRPVPSRSGMLTTVAWADRNTTEYALEGAVAVAGSLIQWLRDQLGFAETAAGVERLALDVPDSGGVFIVPAFSGLFAPRWRADARGTICGLTRFADRRHLARAALEATAFQVAEVLEAMRRDSGQAVSELRVDGGMTVSDLLLGFQADILGVPVVRPLQRETTALGAAVAAGLAVGFWESGADLRAALAEDARFEPRMSVADRDARLADWRRAVERSLDWAQS